MRMLVINCGSSSLKFHLMDAGSPRTGVEPPQRLAYGTIEHLGSQARIAWTRDTQTSHDTVALPDHGAASRWVLDWLATTCSLAPRDLDAIGHRVVHGGARFIEPTLLDDGVIAALTALRELAPLHNDPALAAIRALRDVLASQVPMVAVFDTAFHHTLPAWAAQYAIPHDLAAKYHIRRYGFHGIAHRFMSERYATLTGTPASRLKLITLQLGSGCSATAIDRGRSVDTSMGFTPLEGLMMGTRSGDIDPFLPGFLARQEGVEVAEVETILNTRSGLLGVSGRSRDMRELLQAEAQGDARAKLAVAMFCYRIRKYIAAYLAVLNGAEAIVFGGGIGENAAAVRARICASMDWCGLQLDAARNAAAIGTEARISTEAASLQAYVFPVDEASIIAQDTARCLSA